MNFLTHALVAMAAFLPAKASGKHTADLAPVSSSGLVEESLVQAVPHERRLQTWASDYTNLALNRETVQMSSHTPHKGYALRGVDGVTSPTQVYLWPNNQGASMVHTGGDANPWWKVHLGEKCQIFGIRIYNRVHPEWQNGNRLSYAIIEVINGNAVVSSSTLGDMTGVASIDVDIPGGAVGDIVRVRKENAAEPLVFAEVEVYGQTAGPWSIEYTSMDTDFSSNSTTEEVTITYKVGKSRVPTTKLYPEGCASYQASETPIDVTSAGDSGIILSKVAVPKPNVALGKPATQIDTHGTYVAGNAVDGDWSTFSHTGANNNWWEVDLGQPYSIGRVVLGTYFVLNPSSVDMRLKDFDLILLGPARQEVARVQVDYNVVNKDNFDFTGVSAQYVRIEMPYANSQSNLILTEVEVYEEESLSMDTYELQYDFNKTMIAASDYWNNYTNSIELCQVVQLTEEVASGPDLIFQEDMRNITIDFDLVANFTANVNLTGADINAANATTDLDGYITAYHCDGGDAMNELQVGSKLQPNAELDICFTSSSTDVEIAEITSMIIKGENRQGQGSELPVMTDGNIAIAALTMMRFVNSTSVIVTTRVPINSFDYEAVDASIIVEGSLTMNLVGDSRKLLVAGYKPKQRHLQVNSASEGEASFEVAVGLEPGKPTESDDVGVFASAAHKAFSGGTLAAAGSIIIVISAIW